VRAYGGSVSEAPNEELKRVVDHIGGGYRESQADMVLAISEAITDGKVLLVQAGTGTGKSLGYLVPAVHTLAAGGGRVVVATATLALQRQLMEVDLPTVIAAMSGQKAISFAVLKGRGNYICQARLAGEERGEDADAELPLGVSRGSLELQAQELRSWARETDTGDRDDFAGSVDSRVWRSMSATGRECVGPSRCQFAAECFSEQAKADAAAADVVVTNHALLALDVIDDSGLIPEHDLLIIDEAHEFVTRTTSAATVDLTVAGAERALRAVRPLVEEEDSDHLRVAIDGLDSAVTELGDDQQRLITVPSGLVEPIAALRDAAHVVATAIPKDDSVDAAQRHRAASAVEEIHEVAGRLLAASSEHVVWWGGSTSPGLYVAPLSVAEEVAETLQRTNSAVLTSATLTLGGDFKAFASDIGLDDTNLWEGIDVGSPFDYAKQGILYVASDLPKPGRDGMHDAALERIEDLIDAAGGRTLVLLSSWRAVDTVSEKLAESEEDGTPVLVQRRGESVARLVEEFKNNERSVLVGTRSLFQGVDVPGPACQCVIIDRIPFPRPDDPVLEARSQRVERAGGSGFMAVSVPRAALLLAQGSGRLIRRNSDKGVVAVLDPRLATARYGTFLRRSVPPFWLTTDQATALAALRRLAAGASATDTSEKSDWADASNLAGASDGSVP
jgi:ATP-dependent DNA helicase DinG